MAANGDETQLELDSYNSEYVERLLEDYLQDPSQVAPVWQQYFRNLTGGNGDVLVAPQRPSFRPASVFNPLSQPTASTRSLPGPSPASDADYRLLQHRVDQLVVGYRVHGHRAAKLDPLGLAPRDTVPLDPAHYKLAPADLDREIMTTFGGGDSRPMLLRDLIALLDATYRGHIGFEYMHIPDRKMREWIQQRIERSDPEKSPSHEIQVRILTRLTDAVIFEEFVRKKYIGAHSFSLEGAETLIPLLDLALEAAAEDGLVEVVMAMAHRGRLNVLANIVGKRPVEIFREFEDPYSDWSRGRGDVKYHMGASGDWVAANGGKLHVSLCFNPSHLEYVNPVAMGRIRAKQDRIGDKERRRGMALLVHGDAAFAGEGVVQESLNLSFLKSYSSGGTLHVILNNQLGFTTSPEEGRSSQYCSDVAKMLPVPIFHVNGEYPQAVARVVELAMDFRTTFQRDAVIDMYGYRRWGHNEADEPSFTQPLVYQAIEKRPTIRDSYLKHLLQLGKVTDEEARQIADAERADLEKQFAEAKTAVATEEVVPAGFWRPYFGGREPDDGPDTGVPLAQLQSFLEKLSVVPADFHVHKKLHKMLERRLKMARMEEPVDWAAAEALAFASLAFEGHPVRLSGQDCERGTFSHRHAILHDTVDDREYKIFDRVAPRQGQIDIVNSPLSETGVLGFEYGYSLDYPEALVAWEAQYGDFVNAAQVIIDQFITSAEDKWRRLSGVVMLLPHAFEGKGPEHSSARLERFLFEAAEDNIQIVSPSTPAQYFHCLRRQVKRHWRKPLVVLTPKSLLRHPQVVSPLSELTSGRLRRILPDARQNPAETSGVLLSSGKMYYDLVDAREKQKRQDVAILCVDQYYPLRNQAIAQALKPYPAETPVIWVQEEPENMGAWGYWKHRYGFRMFDKYPLSFVARTPSASPATGSNAAHYREHDDLITRAFRILL
jgi:2-oxoglutarate dehydrogenase E1 component